MQLVLYTWSHCSFCEEARRLLRARGIAFQEEVLDDRRPLLRRLQSASGFRTVPLAMLEGEVIGGLPELRAHLEELGDPDGR